MNDGQEAAELLADSDPFLSLTPAGALYAHAQRRPDETQAALQKLMPREALLRRSAWLVQAADDRAFLAHAVDTGWVHEVQRELRSPDTRLEYYLPHAIAGLSSQRMAALASEDGFCLARAGYSEEEAETLCAMAVDFFEFVQRQQQRGWNGAGQAVSFHESIDMLLPTTTLRLFWVDEVSYWLILGGEPLLNNRALVDLIWGLHTAGDKFQKSGS